MALSERPLALALRALGLGDFLTGVPALRALRAAVPGYEVLLGTPVVLAPLVRLAGVADRVYPVSGLDAGIGWSGPAPALAVNLHGKGPQSTRLLAALRPGRLVAFGSVEAGTPGPEWRPDEHEVDRWCRLVSDGLGAPTDPRDIRLPSPDVDPVIDRAVVIHPGAAFPSRCWPAERFAAVAMWAKRRGLPVAVTGSAPEHQLAVSVAQLAGLPATAVLAGETSLLELAAVVSRARLVVSADTGVAHLATAFATPSVVLFGPVSPQLWGPPPDGPHVAIWHGASPGDPWGGSVDAALGAITADEVIAAAEQLLGAQSAR